MVEPKKIEEFVWEFPKENDMKVPARVYTDEKYMKILQDEERIDWSTLKQLRNVACLPGIQKYAIALADCHPGYGSPIGGVCAMDLQEGIITFGSIGFDINCLPRDTKIITNEDQIKISEFEFGKHLVGTIDGTQVKMVNPLFFMDRPANSLMEIITENGNKIKATEDHPFLTKKGMLQIKNLRENIEVAIINNTKIEWEKIDIVKKIKFKGRVFDFTIPKTHNFIANGFVVSNCGVRTLKTSLVKKDILKKQEELAQLLYNKVPAGLGSRGQLALGIDEIDEVLEKGSEYAIKRGFGLKEDLEFTELNGVAEGADPKAVSRKAKERQYKEVGTLGSGNHYLEVQYVSKIFDEKIAKNYGLEEDQILISIHCGSRGLGHQIGTDYLSELEDATRKYNIQIKDKELVGAPIQSEEGKKYFSAVNAGTNCAFANRQVIAHLTRQCFSKTFGVDEKEIRQLYDVGHNTAKIEEHEIDGKMKKVLVHRKGSTRGFGPNCEGIPKAYKSSGQPIIVGGTMGTASYILAGTEKGMKETFGSTVHGAGRVMSRNQAIKSFRGETLVSELSKKGIIIKGHSLKGLAEEAPDAYKNIYSVIDVTHNAGIAKKVVEMKPLICVKG
ncbi:MAG: RtcB family protein [archaeon]